MKKYRATSTVKLYSGTVGLKKTQADLRPASLRKVGSWQYEILGPVEFKAGEVIGLDDVPKSIEKLLEKPTVIPAKVPVEDDQGQDP